jgi:hypothetical protein
VARRSSGDSHQDDEGDGWYETAPPRQRVQEVKSRLKAFSLTEPQQHRTVLDILQFYGLFHAPMPPRGTTARQIWARAKAAVRRLEAKMHAIRAGHAAPANDREARLSADWPHGRDAALNVEFMKVRSEQYQTRRGGRFIRIPPHRGRRPELEVTGGAQVLDRYVKKECGLPRTHREELIADLFRAAQGLKADIRLEMIERVRSRLKSATPPLSDFDYHHAMGIVSPENEQRYSLFQEIFGAILSDETDEATKERLGDQLGVMFNLNDPDPTSG